MIVKLPYGAGNVTVDLRGMRVRALAPSASSGPHDPGQLVAAALDRPIAGPSLSELARDRRTATVVVPDSTRKIDLPGVLPVLLQRLCMGGVQPGAITVLVACGTHPKVGLDTVRENIGPLPSGVAVIEHDSRDEGALVTVGDLRPDIPLRLHRAAVETDLLVTVGSVRHHYFAGFGGGPKMVFPGVAGYREIQANHSLVLTESETGSRIRDPRCEPGCLVGNPVAEEISRAADARPPDLAVCLVEGRTGGVAWAGAGPWRQSFAAAVERARSWFEVTADSPFALMVASGGGAPSDSSLIQAHKGLDAACRFLAPGGELLYVASIAHGAGSEAMQPFLADPMPERILESLANHWVQYGHTTLRLVEKTARHRICLHSGLEPTLARRLGFEPAPSVAEIVDGWRENHPGETVGVMASGTVYPRS